MININIQNDNRLEDIALVTLKDRYMLDTETSPQEAFARAAKEYAEDDAHAQRIYEYVSKGWFMFSTPILSNAGTTKGLPISCFLNYVPDSRQGLAEHYTENGWLSSMGGGLGGSWSDVRSDGSKISNGGKSSGVIPFIKVVDAQMLAYAQGSSRRGSYAAYLNISHPEIEEFINIRKPTGGDINRKSLNLHHAVVIPDSFMKKVSGEDTDVMWDLIDPKWGNVVKQVNARQLWESILVLRVETGEPYIMFGDTVNEALPYPLKNKNLKVHQSNLCSEIVLPTNEERTAVCCLSSVNLEYYDEWKDTNLVQDLILFLDNVLQSFIDNAPDSMSKAKYSAMMSRDLGLGAMGFHSYLQKKGIPFESVMAKVWNKRIFQDIQAKASAETIRIARLKGSCPDANGSAIRNMHLLAIAPNASSSIICGTSPSIEPVRANIFTQKTLSGSFEIKNKYLRKLLLEKGYDTPEVWKSILANKGSVQHLDILTDEEKEIFKTAPEIDQMWLIEHAADRQPYICQAQSLNLFFTPDVNNKIDAKYLHKVHMAAWKKKLKTLYYLRSEAARRVENVSMKVKRSNIVETQTYSPVYEETTCLSCEG